jgi:hypothetical protein
MPCEPCRRKKPSSPVGSANHRDKFDEHHIGDKHEKNRNNESACGGLAGLILSRWDVHSRPTLFLIDAKGVLRHKLFGSPGEKILDEKINKMITEIEKTTAK